MLTDEKTEVGAMVGAAVTIETGIMTGTAHAADHQGIEIQEVVEIEATETTETVEIRGTAEVTETLGIVETLEVEEEAETIGVEGEMKVETEMEDGTSPASAQGTEQEIRRELAEAGVLDETRSEILRTRMSSSRKFPCLCS